MLKAVLFDLDETLFDRIASVRAFVLQQFAGDVGRFDTVEALADRFTALDDRGNVHKTQVYRQIFEEMGHPAPEIWRGYFADFETNAWRLARPYPAMSQTLLALRAAGYKLGIVTNGETHLQLRSLLALDLDRLTDVYLISEHEQCRKPDPAIFLSAAARLGVAPQACAFVGDTPQTDMIGARKVGMQTIWFPNGLAWPESYDWQPDATISHLGELLPSLQRCQRAVSGPEQEQSAQPDATSAPQDIARA